MKTFYVVDPSHNVAERLLPLAPADVVELYMGVIDDENIFSVSVHEGVICDLDWYWEADLDEDSDFNEGIEFIKCDSVDELLTILRGDITVH